MYIAKFYYIWYNAYDLKRGLIQGDAPPSCHQYRSGNVNSIAHISLKVHINIKNEYLKTRKETMGQMYL